MLHGRHRVHHLGEHHGRLGHHDHRGRLLGQPTREPRSAGQSRPSASPCGRGTRAGAKTPAEWKHIPSALDAYPFGSRWTHLVLGSKVAVLLFLGLLDLLSRSRSVLNLSETLGRDAEAGFLGGLLSQELVVRLGVVGLLDRRRGSGSLLGDSSFAFGLGLTVGGGGSARLFGSGILDGLLLSGQLALGVVSAPALCNGLVRITDCTSMSAQMTLPNQANGSIYSHSGCL